MRQVHLQNTRILNLAIRVFNEANESIQRQVMEVVRAPRRSLKYLLTQVVHC